MRSCLLDAVNALQHSTKPPNETRSAKPTRLVIKWLSKLILMDESKESTSAKSEKVFSPKITHTVVADGAQLLESV